MPTPDGRKIITNDEGGVVNIWEAATGKHLRRVVATRQRPMALSPDGRYLVWPLEEDSVQFSTPDKPNTIHTGCRLCLYDLAEDKVLDRFAPFKGDAWSTAFTPDGKSLVTVDRRDGMVRSWDVATGQEKRQFRAARPEEKKEYFVQEGVLSPDGKTRGGFLRAR